MLSDPNWPGVGFITTIEGFIDIDRLKQNLIPIVGVKVCQKVLSTSADICQSRKPGQEFRTAFSFESVPIVIFGSSTILLFIYARPFRPGSTS